MNRINRKIMLRATGEWVQHPRPYLKRLGNKRIRKEDLYEDSGPPHQSKKRDRTYRRPGLCPMCLDNIRHQYKHNRTKQHGSCKRCGAVKHGNLRCSHCRSKNMWVSQSTVRCKQCGMYHLHAPPNHALEPTRKRHVV